MAAARGELRARMVRDAMRQTVLTVGSIIWLVLGAVSLIGIYNRIGGGDFLRGILSGLDMPPLMIVLVMMLIVMVIVRWLWKRLVWSMAAY